MKSKILIVDDDQSMCEMLKDNLLKRGFDTAWFTSGEKAFARLKEEVFDVLLTDLKMSGMNGIELCQRVAATRPDVPVVVMTAFGSLDTAIAAIRAGAYDFVTKPVDLDILVLSLERAIRHRSLQEKVRILSEAVKETQRYVEIIGDSSPMRELFSNLSRMADTDASVLITGESGTGKELVAQALHKQSRRKSGPFVAINCSALPENLLESELFGHKRGSFTDAKADRSGLIMKADGGTLLLDEIGDFPMALQPKLLRALEERRVRPIGSDREIAFNARIITATNHDLESSVEDGRFREDLFYRVNVIQVKVPPLRVRGTDILLIARHFLKQFATRSGKRVTDLSRNAAEKLLSYSWPGNVRELRNCVERAVALTCFNKLTVEDFPEKIRTHRNRHILIGSNDPTELIPLEEVERRYIRHVLESVGGNRTLAARVLGLDRKTLYRKLQRYGEF